MDLIEIYYTPVILTQANRVKAAHTKQVLGGRIYLE